MATSVWTRDASFPTIVTALTTSTRFRSSRPTSSHRWRVRDSLETYGVSHWGKDFFVINEEGHLVLTHDGAAVDLKVLVDDLIERGISLPILLRFSGLLDARIKLLNEAFANAIAEYGYSGSYRGVYPIKVNQSRKVVDAITRSGARFHYGLEAGSKPELLAAMALLHDREALIVCNGYKDEHYIETALLASRLRGHVILVVEKPSELALIARVSDRLGIQPSIGIRMKLSAKGAGKWQESGGDHAKFGLTAGEILGAVEELRRQERLPCLKLLHFHLGSQITAIRSVKDALREATRMYAELRKLGCEGLGFFDVGGGLGVDYDGSQTNFDYSMNYSVQEYANDVVYSVQDACDAEEIPHPTLVSESGRAVVAHHSILVVDVIGVTASTVDEPPMEAPPEDAHDIAHELWEIYNGVTRKNVRELYHDASDYKDQVLQLFNLGHLSLFERARCEKLFWASCHRMRQIAKGLSRVPDELQKLDRFLSDTYFCNFSMFQSLPDVWAVDQLFPVMPIHRLTEEPTRPAILADITCDSDGKIDAFTDLRDVRDTLPLHSPNGEPYHLGIMFTGAYQEILGDMHNLFGDTNVVSVDMSEGAGGYVIDEVVYGDTVEDVLRYVDYQPKELINSLRKQVEVAVQEGHMSLNESRQLMQRYRDGLASYTYLE